LEASTTSGFLGSTFNVVISLSQEESKKKDAIPIIFNIF
jgi:hypothetical protein